MQIKKREIEFEFLALRKERRLTTWDIRRVARTASRETNPLLSRVSAGSITAKVCERDVIGALSSDGDDFVIRFRSAEAGTRSRVIHVPLLRNAERHDRR